MCQTLEITLEDIESHFVCLPIVDMLHYEPDLRAYLVTFVPNEYVSSDSKEMVVVPNNCPEGRRIEAQMKLLSSLLGKGRAVTKVFHGGGALFTLHLSDGSVCELGDGAIDLETTLLAINALQDMAQAAEITFVLASRTAA